MIKGIDVSEMNGIIDFKKVKEDDIEFVMIRATYGRYKEDKMFKRNIEEATKVGLKVGIYYYSYALSIEQAKEEVSNLLKVINPYKDKIKYPVVIDMEDSDGYKANFGMPSNEVLCDIVRVAGEKISASGYYYMCYANKDWWENKLNVGMENTPKWLAWWNVEEDKIEKSKYGMWQKTSEGVIKGIGTKVDINFSFVDFEKLIEYLNNIKKIQYIKLRTGLEDLTIQFMSCYKFGQDLINKIYFRLQDLKKVTSKDSNLHKAVQKEYGFEDKTRVFLEYYLYAEELFLKLYRAICEDTNKCE